MTRVEDLEQALLALVYAVATVRRGMPADALAAVPTIDRVGLDFRLSDARKLLRQNDAIRQQMEARDHG